VNRQVLAYRDDVTGNLYYLNGDTGQDAPLTPVEVGPGWFQAPHRPCDQEGRVQEEAVPYVGPSGQFANALAIGYRAFGCADTGIASERYIESLGLVQRTIQTIAGLVHYDLVHASIGPVSVTEWPSTSFSVGVRRPLGPRVIADLRWNASGEGAVLRMPTSQEYEVLLRDSNGNVVWRWSDGKFFTPQLRRRSARHLSYEVEIPLQIYGILLPEGIYTVEAWLATIPERQFAGAKSFQYTHPTLPGSSKQ
jgi:hypothetical protein